MDPSTLSMEQGKQFLKQCGIPQRDIDLMTEKWEVVASVEVLLRFPLMQGEDPTARCVSNTKAEPPGYQVHNSSQIPRDQQERESSSQLTSRPDPKPHVRKPRSSPSLSHHPPRPTNVGGVKKQPVQPVRLAAPSAEEEKTMVKCKNCGAFGHSARSTRCPIKSWGKYLSFQPLGSRQEKENLKPRKPQEPQTVKPFSKNDREKSLRPCLEEPNSRLLPQRVPGRFPKKVLSIGTKSAEAGPLLRKFRRPALFQMPKKKPAQGPVVIGPAPVRSPDTTLLCPMESHRKRLALSPHGPAKAHEMGHIKNISQEDISSSKTMTAKYVTLPWNGPQPATEYHALVHSLKPQIHTKCPTPDSRPSSQSFREDCSQDSSFRIQAPGKKFAQGPVQTSQKPPKKARVGAFPNSQPKPQFSHLGTYNCPQSCTGTNGLGPKQIHKKATETPTLKPSINFHPLSSSPFLSPAQNHAVFQPVQSNHDPVKPERPGSKRWEKGWMSSSVSMAPTSNDAVKCTPSCQSSQLFIEPERQGPQGPRSVLYEDLLVSSSSDDSDCE